MKIYQINVIYATKNQKMKRVYKNIIFSFMDSNILLLQISKAMFKIVVINYRINFRNKS